MSRPETCKHADWLIVQRNDGYRWVTCTECHTDFILRRGVESGTIKGEEIVAREAGLIRQGFDPGTYLVIPVSDGGSET